ncbi:MAG: Sapep family Mn(2+)-dependent dipeptidase [Clostridia bacterium]|nr:Sapep family Mn(2+)-dependent dipeptidase [Clostridia bacterium]
MNVYFNNAIEKIKELVKIKSVKDTPKKDMPFGEGVYKALQTMLNLGKSLGFNTVNYDNYIGEITFGEGNDIDGLAILCHLDVVPEGDESKWLYPPYSATEVDGKIYGRGVVDDKSPAVLCLYALKELKDKGFIPKRKIKLILGCDEESGWDCIEHYKKVAVMPKNGFSPDGDFPVIYAEKGIYHVEFNFKANNRIISLIGGERTNMVCDYACVELDSISKEENQILVKNGLTVENNTIKAYGKSAHGSTPEVGDNAIKKLFYGLAKIQLLPINVYNGLFENKELFNSIKDETGCLTFSPNVCRLDNGVLKIATDIRYPATYSLEKIKSLVEKIGNYVVLHHQNPIISDKNGKLVKTLLNIYNKEFNKNEKPIAIGGGTYARALENGVAFGPSIVGDSRCHIPNEYIGVEELNKCYKIYYKAIEELTK